MLTRSPSTPSSGVAVDANLHHGITTWIFLFRRRETDLHSRYVRPKHGQLDDGGSARSLEGACFRRLQGGYRQPRHLRISHPRRHRLHRSGRWQNIERWQRRVQDTRAISLNTSGTNPSRSPVHNAPREGRRLNRGMPARPRRGSRMWAAYLTHRGAATADGQPCANRASAAASKTRASAKGGRRKDN